MAKSWTARLDKLERLANDLINQQLGPVYVRPDQKPHIDPSRLVVVTRIYVSPPERDEVSLPRSQPSPDNLFGADQRRVQDFNRKLETPAIGIVREGFITLNHGLSAGISQKLASS